MNYLEFLFDCSEIILFRSYSRHSMGIGVRYV